MTKALEQAFAEAANLPDDDQEALAQWILEELRSERRWERSFQASQGILSKLADEATLERRSGQTKPLSTSDV